MSEPIEETRQLSRRTTPTWEVELLISGVAVFAMLQLPGWLDDGLFALMPRLDEQWRMVLLPIYFYAKSAAVILAITFALHLFLRAMWIALVGIHSVFPQGVDFNRLKMGPIQREVEETAYQPTEVLIERADNRASVVFAFGVTIASIIVAIVIALALTFLLGTALSLISGGRIAPYSAAIGVFLAVMVPFALLSWLDQRLGNRWPADSRRYRLTRTLLRLYARAGIARVNSRVIALLSSHRGERLARTFMTATLFLVLGGVSLSWMAMRESERFGSYAGFPAASQLPARAADAAHYDDQRNAARDDRLVPYISTMVASSSYLKLVVPYQPTRDEAAMRRICAHASQLPPAARELEQLRCLSTLRTVTLDGKALPGMQYELTSDPRTDRPALLAMIDLRGLSRGRHELRIAASPRAPKERGRDNDRDADRILFWR